MRYHFSLPADLFQTETCDRFAFTCYRREVYTCQLSFCAPTRNENQSSTMFFPGPCITMCITRWQNIVAQQDPLCNGNRAMVGYLKLGYIVFIL